MNELTDRFIDALHQLHADRRPDALVDLFGDDATLSKLGGLQEAHGQDGARTFWQQYRDFFDDIEAEFTGVVQDEHTAALEWTSRGSLRSGDPFTYQGVSVIEGAGDRIAGFRTYYDSAAFLAERPK